MDLASGGSTDCTLVTTQLRRLRTLHGGHTTTRAPCHTTTRGEPRATAERRRKMLRVTPAAAATRRRVGQEDSKTRAGEGAEMDVRGAEQSSVSLDACSVRRSARGLERGELERAALHELRCEFLRAAAEASPSGEVTEREEAAARERGGGGYVRAPGSPGSPVSPGLLCVCLNRSIYKSQS
ncbi:unnamed protein product [Lampetra fluviatilis]